MLGRDEVVLSAGRPARFRVERITAAHVAALDESLRYVPWNASERIAAEGKRRPTSPKDRFPLWEFECGLTRPMLWNRLPRGIVSEKNLSRSITPKAPDGRPRWDVFVACLHAIGEDPNVFFALDPAMIANDLSDRIGAVEYHHGQIAQVRKLLEDSLRIVRSGRVTDRARTEQMFQKVLDAVDRAAFTRRIGPPLSEEQAAHIMRQRMRP